MICPSCEQDEGFEKRGTVRRYFALNQDLEGDGDSEDGDPDIDTDGRGNEIIYCNNCDAELTAEEIRAANEEPKAVAYVEVDPKKTIVLVNEPVSWKGGATRVRLP